MSERRDLLADARRRQRDIAREARFLDRLLATYYHAASGIPSPSAATYEVRHENPAQDCGCTLCRDWHARRKDVESVLPLVEGHRWANCDCAFCTVARQLHFGFLSATNRRDLWTEMTYHVAVDKALRPRASEVLAVVKSELEDSQRTNNWWALEGGRMPMGFWFRRVERRLGMECLAA